MFALQLNDSPFMLTKQPEVLETCSKLRFALLLETLGF